jgi:hypothetical protein
VIWIKDETASVESNIKVKANLAIAGLVAEMVKAGGNPLPALSAMKMETVVAAT